MGVYIGVPLFWETTRYSQQPYLNQFSDCTPLPPNYQHLPGSDTTSLALPKPKLASDSSNSENVGNGKLRMHDNCLPRRKPKDCVAGMVLVLRDVCSSGASEMGMRDGAEHEYSCRTSFSQVPSL